MCDLKPSDTPPWWVQRARRRQRYLWIAMALWAGVTALLCAL